MTTFKNYDWDSVKALCDKVEGIDKKAMDKGLTFSFDVQIGIYDCRVYGCLYKKRKGDNDINYATYLEYNYFEKKKEFDAFLEEVKRVLATYDEDDDYERELEALNKKYGRR